MIDSILNTITKNNVPEFVYHGSPKKNIKTLKPYPSEVMDGEEVVFAGDLWVAVSCIRFWNDTDITQGTHSFSHSVVSHFNKVNLFAKHGKQGDRPYLEERYKGAFSHVFNGGGYVYKLSSKTFSRDKRIGNYEYISREPVSTISAEYIADPLKKLKELNVDLNYYR